MAQLDAVTGRGVTSRRGLHTAIVIGVSGVCMVVVALGARGGGGYSPPPVPTAAWRVVSAVVAGLVAGVAIAALVVVTASITGHRWRRGKGSNFWVIERSPARWAGLVAPLLAALVMLVVAVGGVAVLASGASGAPHVTSHPLATGSVAPSDQGTVPPDGSPLPAWALGAGALSAAGLTVWALGAPARRRRGGQAPDTTEQEAQDAAVHRAVEILTDETDPRRAVIAAYAAMERLLATAGAARNPAEAPFEYVARNPLLNSAGRAAAHRLSELFETARFSLHSVDEATRGRALSALRVIATEIAQ